MYFQKTEVKLSFSLKMKKDQRNFKTKLGYLEAVAGGWGNCAMKTLINLYPSPTILRVIISRMKWMVHVPHMGKSEIHIKLRSENLRGRYHLGGKE
jgi:hypothetical protein